MRSWMLEPKTNTRNIIECRRDSVYEEDKLTDAEICAIAKVLETDTQVRTLRLRGHNISKKGVTAIAEMLKVNRGIDTLDLGENSINNACASILATGLAANT